MTPAWLAKGRNQHSAFDGSLEEFLPINRDAIADRLRLVDHGKERGAADLPGSEETSPDHIEMSVVSEVSNHARNAQSDLISHFQAFRERANSILARDTTDRIRSLAQKAATDMLAEVRAGTGILFNQKRDFVLADRDLDSFRSRHGVTRPAYEPPPRFALVAVLALLWVVESLANAFLIGDASEFGVLGGFAEMIAISGVNIALGWLTGRLIAPLFLLEKVRIFFFISFGAAVAAIGAFNLFVGHYRDVIAISASDMGVVNFGSQAVDRLFASPFGLEDFKSWIFVLVGVLFSLFSGFDGWKFDEPYPGYGSRDRRHKLQVREYGRRFSSLQNDLSQLAENRTNEINGIVLEAGQHQQELQTIRERVSGLRARLESFIEQLKVDGDFLLQTYRQTNIGARNAPPPKHFSQKISEILDFKVPPEIEIAGAIDVEGLRLSAKEARRVIEAAHRDLLDVYKTIDHLSEADLEKASAMDFQQRVSDLGAKIQDELPV